MTCDTRFRSTARIFENPQKLKTWNLDAIRKSSKKTRTSAFESHFFVAIFSNFSTIKHDLIFVDCFLGQNEKILCVREKCNKLHGKLILHVRCLLIESTGAASSEVAFSSSFLAN